MTDPRAAGYGKYALCVYDQADSVPRLREDLVAASGTCAGQPCWKAAGGGYKQHNKSLLPSGVSIATLRASGTGGVLLSVKGQGRWLGLEPLPASGRVRVELHRAGGNDVCWAAEYSQPTVNSGGLFNGSSD